MAIRKNTLINEWEEIISRLKEHTNCTKQSELAEILDISSNDFSMRKKKGTLLQLIIPWAIHQNVSLDWIFYGKETVSFENANLIDLKHFDVVREFNDRETALEINQNLKSIEDISPKKFYEIGGYVKGTLNELKPIANMKKDNKLG